MESTTINEKYLAEFSSYFEKESSSIHNEYLKILNSRVKFYKEILSENSSDLEKVVDKDFNPDNELVSKGFHLKFPLQRSILKITKYSTSLQKWIGHVLDIDEFSFTARIDELNRTNDIYETAEFNKSEISSEDLKLLEIGAIFYWNVGYSVENGQKKKESIVMFKRDREWSEDDFNLAIDQANDLYSKLKVS